MKRNHNSIEKLIEAIKNSKNIVFFGGAGVSTESDIPDFRSKDGLYNQKDVHFEDIPPHSRDFSHELGGNPIKGPQFLAKKTNEKSYLLY